MAIPLQLGFADYEQTYAKKKTRRQIFLEQMEATLPWDLFLSLIRPVYHQPSAKGGRPPFPLEVMLRIHLLQQWFTLSDPLMEEMLIDTPCFRRFAGIDPGPIKGLSPEALIPVSAWGFVGKFRS
jgi:IS5 family transposase